MFKRIGAWFKARWKTIKRVLVILLITAFVMAIMLPAFIVGFRTGWQARGFHDKLERSPFVNWLKPKEAPAPPEKDRHWLVPQKRPPNRE